MAGLALLQSILKKLFKRYGQWWDSGRKAPRLLGSVIWGTLIGCIVGILLLIVFSGVVFLVLLGLDALLGTKLLSEKIFLIVVHSIAAILCVALAIYFSYCMYKES